MDTLVGYHVIVVVHFITNLEPRTVPIPVTHRVQYAVVVMNSTKSNIVSIFMVPV